MCRPRQARCGRVAILRRDSRGEFRLARDGQVELKDPRALSSWITPCVRAVVFLAHSYLQSEPTTATPQRVLNGAFERILARIRALRTPVVVILASSTAARASSNSVSYAHLKRKSEKSLHSSNLNGSALRFPTILPRSEKSRGPSSFLNAALREYAGGRPYDWPIAPDRAIRLISAPRAAEQIVTALCMVRRASTIETPATITTPHELHDVWFRSMRHSATFHVQPEIDEAMANRPVFASDIASRALGFSMQETPASMLQRSIDFLSRYDQT